MENQNGPKNGAVNAVLEKMDVFNRTNQDYGPEQTSAALSDLNMSEGMPNGRANYVLEFKGPEIKLAALDRIRELMLAKIGTTGAATLEGYERPKKVA